MKIDLLVDSGEFWPRLLADLRSARESVLLQTFSFEGDVVGSALGRALEECTAPDRRLLVDRYSLLYHSDRVTFGPALLRREFREELRSTRSWVRRLRRGGVDVRFGNPLGPSPVRLLQRNHKKLVVLDGRVTYLGGINFCDHNFDWHDMMLRIEDTKLARHLAGDYLASWNGAPVASDRSVGPLRVISLNGRRNPEQFEPLLYEIDRARHSLDVVSAYLSPPFSDHLALAAARGVRVRVITPERNNKPTLGRFVALAARTHGFQVIRYPGRMNHLKAMVVDGELLVAGSSNFDFVSFHFLEELVVMSRDMDLVERFRRKVWDPDLLVSNQVPERLSIRTLLAHMAVVTSSRISAAFALLGEAVS